MQLYAKFGLGLPLEEFLAKYGTDAHKARWNATWEHTILTDEQRQLLSRFRREMHVLVLAGAWCGDCSSQCPIFERFAEVAPVIRIRYIDRDDHADAQAALQINGGNRVPVVVFFSEDGFEVSRFGDRPLARYRQLAAQQAGEGCVTGWVHGDAPGQQAVVQDWLNEFERVQWILRLSPRLRRLHGD